VIPSLDSVSQTCRIERTLSLTRAEHLARLVEDAQPAPRPQAVRFPRRPVVRWLGVFTRRPSPTTS